MSEGFASRTSSDSAVTRSRTTCGCPPSVSGWDSTERKHHIAVLASHQLAQASVVRNERRDDTECASSFVGVSVPGELIDGHEQEGHGNGEEECDESEVFAQSTKQHEHAKDKPCRKIYAKGIPKLLRVVVCREDTGRWNEDGSIGDPEGAIGCEHCGTEVVSSGELPHAGEYHGETTREDSHSDDNIGSIYASGVHVVQRPDKYGRSE